MCYWKPFRYYNGEGSRRTYMEQKKIEYRLAAMGREVSEKPSMIFLNNHKGLVVTWTAHLHQRVRTPALSLRLQATWNLSPTCRSR